MSDDIELLVMKANSGDLYSQYLLGALYAKGIDVSQNLTQSLFWYLEAAKKSYAPALWNAGILILDGEEEIKQDSIVGMKLIEKAAFIGDSSACMFLVNCYKYGLEKKEKNIETAKYWEQKTWVQEDSSNEDCIDIKKEFGIIIKKTKPIQISY